MAPAFEPLARTCEALRAAGLDGALVASPANVTYVSGWEAPLGLGPFADIVEHAPLAYALVSAREDAGWLVVADVYGAWARRDSRLETLETFGTLGMTEPVDHRVELVGALRRALAATGLDAGARLAVEARALPAALLTPLGLRSEAPDAAPVLQRARLIKTAEEIERLRNAARVADAGQRRLLALAPDAVGASELEVWGELTSAMEQAAGVPLTLSGELMVAERTCRLAFPSRATERSIEAGDTGLLDVSPRVAGYWADCTNTVVFGAEPTDDQRRYALAAQQACAAAIETLRPGARASEAAFAHRDAMAEHGFGYAHYTGHQIGVTVNEQPRLVFYDDTVVEAGMVFAVEPGIYGGDDAPTGARAERMVLVTEHGPEDLSQFPWGIA